MRPFVHPYAVLGSAVLATWVSSVFAADESFEGSGSMATSTSDRSSPDGYLSQYRPFDGALEIGAFAGLLFMSGDNSFRRAPTVEDNRLSLSPYSEYKQPAPEFGIRVGYYPLAFLGGELEGMAALASTEDGDGASALAGRAQLVVQSPLWSVVPFVFAGAGYWAVQNDVSGNDADPAFQFGGGFKVAASGNFAFRVDVRDSISNKRADRDPPNHLEVTAGAHIVLGRPDPAPLDTDADGFLDGSDRCPMQAGVEPDGCPLIDADGDQIPDSSDQCPAEAGPAPSGCPVVEAIADADSDGVEDSADECMTVPGIRPTGCPDGDDDGVLDRDDQCPEQIGLAPDGCPGDSDGDGIRDPEDKCPTQAETDNGFEDEDGCPDEVPDVVKRFTGAIPGIGFASNRADIGPGSREVLTEAAKVLEEYPALRVEIIGHTDDRGARAHNLDLSLRRAESVKAFLVSQGIDSGRIEVRGAGPDEPLVAEQTRAARQKNRRIEFRVIRASEANGPPSSRR